MPVEGHGRNLAVWTSGVSFVLPSKALASRASETPLHGGQRDLGLLRVSCPSSERGTNRTSGCSVWLAIHPPATIDAHRLDCAPSTPASLPSCSVWICVTLNLHPCSPWSGCLSGARKRLGGTGSSAFRQSLTKLADLTKLTIS